MVQSYIEFSICGFYISYKLQSIVLYFEELFSIKIVELILFAIFYGYDEFIVYVIQYYVKT
jgi:hypothetical protein